MTTCIGQTLVLKGRLSAAEDIRIAGRIEGDIQLHDHVLTVQPTGELAAEVLAGSVIVEGVVRGDIVAAHSIALQQTASVSGKIAAPRIAIHDGANFNGSVDTVLDAADLISKQGSTDVPLPASDEVRRPDSKGTRRSHRPAHHS